MQQISALMLTLSKLLYILSLLPARFFKTPHLLGPCSQNTLHQTLGTPLKSKITYSSGAAPRIYRNKSSPRSISNLEIVPDFSRPSEVGHLAEDALFEIFILIPIFVFFFSSLFDGFHFTINIHYSGVFCPFARVSVTSFPLKSKTNRRFVTFHIWPFQKINIKFKKKNRIGLNFLKFRHPDQNFIKF